MEYFDWFDWFNFSIFHILFLMVLLVLFFPFKNIDNYRMNKLVNNFNKFQNTTFYYYQNYIYGAILIASYISPVTIGTTLNKVFSIMSDLVLLSIITQFFFTKLRRNSKEKIEQKITGFYNGIKKVEKKSKNRIVLFVQIFVVLIIILFVYLSLFTIF